MPGRICTKIPRKDYQIINQRTGVYLGQWRTPERAQAEADRRNSIVGTVEWVTAPKVVLVTHCTRVP